LIHSKVDVVRKPHTNVNPSKVFEIAVEGSFIEALVRLYATDKEWRPSQLWLVLAKDEDLVRARKLIIIAFLVWNDCVMTVRAEDIMEVHSSI